MDNDMSKFSPRERANCKEAVRLSLEAVKDWIPKAKSFKDPSGKEVELSDESKTKILSEIDSALNTLNITPADTFDLKDLFSAGHATILAECLEFYGEYVNNILSYIGFSYRLAFKERFNMWPEELALASEAAAAAKTASDPTEQ